MDIEKIISIVGMYQERLVKEGIPKKPMDPNKAFASLTKEEVLAHAHFISDGVEKYAAQKGGLREVGARLATIQICLSLAGWYTLKELMDHGLLATKEENDKMFKFLKEEEGYLESRLSRLSGQIDARLPDFRDVEMELYAIGRFKYCLEEIKDLDGKKALILLDELIEEFKEQEKPVGLDGEASNEWRLKMIDHSIIRGRLQFIKNNLNKIYN